MIEDKIKEIPGAEEYLAIHNIFLRLFASLINIFLGIGIAILSMLLVFIGILDSINPEINGIKSIPIIGDIAANEIMKFIQTNGEKIFFGIIETSFIIAGIICLVFTIIAVIFYLYYNNKANTKYQEYVNTLKK